MSGLKVIKPSIAAMIQDLGRFNYSHLGVGISGVADEYAYLVSQQLLGNTQNCNTLEMNFAGLQLEAQQEMLIAITGADFGLNINGVSCKPWQTYCLKPGDHLHFTQKKVGEVAYLSVKGGFKSTFELGSYSTTIKESLGTVLKKGMLLECEASSISHTHRLKRLYWSNYEKQELTLRVLLGYQHDQFSAQMKELFFAKTFELSNQKSRMGAKLKGEAITPNCDGIISEGICFGAIQIPKDGQPIILLKEHQTIGGYPKIGTVLSLDCFKLSQAKAGTRIRFKPILLKEAQELIQEFYESFT